jgi:hypothetical protein
VNVRFRGALPAGAETRKHSALPMRDRSFFFASSTIATQLL